MNAAFPLVELAAGLSECGRMIDAAHAYAARGVAVFPLSGKVPLEKDGAGLYDASCEPLTVGGWWRRWPRANIGWIPWSLGCVGIDVDSAGLAAWTRLCGLHEAVHTLSVRSGRGGLHVLFRVPPGVVLGCSPGRLPSGIHVRGKGGYLVAPPSVHPETGARYVFEDLATPAELPGWLLTLIMPPVRIVPSQPASGRVYTDGPSIFQGSRNWDLFRVGSGMRARGLGGEELEQALLEANQARCLPPLEEHEVVKMARNIAARFPAGA